MRIAIAAALSTLALAGTARAQQPAPYYPQQQQPAPQQPPYYPPQPQPQQPAPQQPPYYPPQPQPQQPAPQYPPQPGQQPYYPPQPQPQGGPPPGYQYQQQPPPQQMVQQPVVRQPRSGIFATADLGLTGYGVSRNNSSVTGGGVGLRGAVGFMVSPSLAVFGGLSYFESGTLTIKEGSQKLETEDVTLSAVSFLGGARFYTDSDFYFEGTVGTTKHAVEFDDASLRALNGSSKTGFLLGAGLGKEWVMDSGLAIAAGGRLGVGAVPAVDNGDSHAVLRLDFFMALGYAGR